MLAHHVFDVSHGLLIHDLLGALDIRRVVPAMRDQDLDALLVGLRNERSSVCRVCGEGFLAHHVQTPFQGRHCVLEMQRVRRGDNDTVQAFDLKKLFVVLGRMHKSERVFDHLQLVGTESANCRHLHIFALCENRHVVGSRPPTSADKADLYGSVSFHHTHPLRRYRSRVNPRQHSRVAK